MTRKILAIFFACALLPGFTLAADKDPAAHRAEVHADVMNTIARFKKTDPAMEHFFKSSVGYAVFARV
ncbi:MAG TPA: hypothetical protein VMJ14_15175, partial [Burkholderiales bacterium]|nr:hypothetical protein [Burkholderiales bacterium]